MANVPNLSVVQPPSGRPLTINDDTTYEDPISNYVRTVEVWTSINGTGTLVDTLTFSGTDLTVEYDITADDYFSFKLIHVGSPAIAVKYLNITTRQFEINRLFELNAKNCGCVKPASCDKRVNGFIDMYMSQIATEGGNSALARTSIKNSLKWLNS